MERSYSLRDSGAPHPGTRFQCPPKVVSRFALPGHLAQKIRVEDFLRDWSLNRYIQARRVIRSRLATNTLGDSAPCFGARFPRVNETAMSAVGRSCRPARRLRL